MEQFSNKSRAFLSKLDDQQLRQILLAEVESDDTDVDLIRNITAVLESRDYAGMGIDVRESYQSFVENHSEDMPLYDELLKLDDSPKKRKPVRFSRLARIGIVAAVILSFVIVTTGIASAAGIDVWGAITRWTAKTFGVTLGNTEKTIDMNVSNDACQDIRQILLRYGITENTLPYYLPDGYKLYDSSEVETYVGTVVTAVYRSETGEIVFLYTINPPESSTMYPKDQEEPLTYEYSGVNHYIFENENEWVTIWQRNDIRCQISGVSSKEELLKIINSIYEGK